MSKLQEIVTFFSFLILFYSMIFQGFNTVKLNHLKIQSARLLLALLNCHREPFVLRLLALLRHLHFT